MAGSPPYRLLTSPSPKSSSQADLALVRGALDSRPEDLEALSERLGLVPRLLGAMNARRGTPFKPADLEDMAQDVVSKILEKLHTFRGEATLKTWFWQFAHLEFLSRLRKRSRHVTPVELSVAEPASTDSSASDEDLAVWLSRLTAEESEIVRRKALDGFTFEEVAGQLDLSENTVKTRYYRALSNLREFLNNRGVFE